MTTWTLTDPHMADGYAISDLLRDGVPVLRRVDYNAARQHIYAHGDDADLYLEAENPRYQGETVGTLKARDADMQQYYDGEITLGEFARRWPCGVRVVPTQQHREITLGEFARRWPVTAPAKGE